MNVELEKLYAYVDKYSEILAVAKGFDGKVMDKNVIEAIDKIEGIYVRYYKNSDVMYKKVSHTFSIYSDVDVAGFSYYLDVYNCEKAGIIRKDGLFVFSAFEKACLETKNYYLTQIQRINEDLKTGKERLRQCQSLIEQARALKDTFSNLFLETHYLASRI